MRLDPQHDAGISLTWSWIGLSTVDWKIFTVKIIRVLNFRVKYFAAQQFRNVAHICIFYFCRLSNFLTAKISRSTVVKLFVLLGHGWFLLSGWQAHSSSGWRSLPVWARAADEGSRSTKTLSNISCGPAITRTSTWVRQLDSQSASQSVIKSVGRYHYPCSQALPC